MIKSIFYFIVTFLVFSSCSGTFKKSTIFGLALYSTKAEFYYKLDELVERRVIFKISSKNNPTIYYAEYQDSTVALGLNNDVPPGTPYKYYGVIAPVLRGNYVEQVKVYFVNEINEMYAPIYGAYYKTDQALFMIDRPMNKNPYSRIISNMNAKYGSWYSQYNQCDPEMVFPNLPFESNCVHYKWENEGVQIKFTQMAEYVNFTTSMHLAYTLDSASVSRYRKEIDALLGEKEQDKF